MKHLFRAGALWLLLLPTAVCAGEDDRRPTPHPSDANVTGHVLNARTHEHLSYITISVKGTTVGTVTDATGHYFLKNLAPGAYTVVASSVGFKTAEKQIDTERDKTVELNFALEEEIVDMDEVVVSATRNETNKRGAATIVNVTSAKLFENTASNNLAESMDFQPGLRVEYNCGNCGVPQLRINGLEGQYSQVLLDSRPIFSSLASVYGLEQMPVSMVERVEVVRGGGSALFGSSAIGGVVNIITRDPLRNSVVLSNTTNIFEDGKTDINTSFNGSFVTDDQRAGVYLFGMVRDRDWYDRNGDGFSEIPKLSSQTVGFRGYYKTGAHSRLTAEYHHMHEFRRGGDSFDRPPHEAMIAEQLNHKIDGGGLQFTLHSPDYRHRFELYASAQAISRDSYFGTDRNLDAYGHTNDRVAVGGTQYSYRFEKLLFMPAELTGGVEYNYNMLHDSYFAMNRDLQQTTHIFGAFLQNEWKNDKVGLLVGARLDKHNLMRNVVCSPRATVRYSPTENVGLRASYSSGYRAPQTYNEDLHVAAVSGALSLISLDPDLKPEYSHSISASADLYHSFGSVQGNLLVEGFYTSLRDVFMLVKTGEDADGNLLFERRNGAGARVQGINVEMRLAKARVFDLQMGYTFQRSRYTEPERWSDDVDPQQRMFRAPDHYGYVSAAVDLTPKFKASLFGKLTGPMLVQHNAGYIEQDTQRVTPAFFDMGVRLAYTLRLTHAISLELSTGVKNLLDSFQPDLDYGPLKDAGYIYGPSLPRMYFVGAKFFM